MTEGLGFHVVNFRSITELCKEYKEKRDTMPPMLQGWLEAYMGWVADYLVLRSEWNMDRAATINDSRHAADAPTACP